MSTIDKLMSVKKSLELTLAQALTTACAFPEYKDGKAAVDAGRAALATLDEVIAELKPRNECPRCGHTPYGWVGSTFHGCLHGEDLDKFLPQPPAGSEGR